MPLPNAMFAYAAPEAFLPMASALAIVAGFVLTFGRHTLRLVGRWFQLATTRQTREPAVKGD